MEYVHFYFPLFDHFYIDISNYIDEFETYADGYQDFCAYYFQQCEMDAREYGESAVEDYYARIEAYLESY